MPSRVAPSVAVLVRPYDVRIRERVRHLLESLNHTVDPRRTIAPGTPNPAAVELLSREVGRTLVVPFHAHRDWDGQTIDGLGLLQQLAARFPEFPWRVLMPVSRVGAAAAMLRVRGSLSPSVRERVLLVYEDELDTRTTLERARLHLGAEQP